MKQIEIIEEEMTKLAKQITEGEKQNSQRENDAPCNVCGGKNFVQKFRNVTGKINGEMTGYFFLFGGTVTGKIDGKISTLPVLSCRGCGNEKKISTWNYNFESDVFWNLMYSFYNMVEYGGKRNIDKLFLENPIGTREFMIKNHNYDEFWYNDMVNWEPKIWAAAGFDIKPIKRKFLFWEWEDYPTWEELTRSNK